MAKRVKQDVLRTVKEEGVKFIRLWFTDILGQVKSFAITDSPLPQIYTSLTKPELGSIAFLTLCDIIYCRGFLIK